MSKHQKLNRNFLILVDNYRREDRRHKTYGRYRVGAKNEREAIALVMKAIKFGTPHLASEYPDRLLPHGVVKKEIYRVDENDPGKAVFELIDPVSDTDPVER